MTQTKEQTIMRTPAELRELVIDQLQAVDMKVPFRIRTFTEAMDDTSPAEQEMVYKNFATWCKGKFPSNFRLASMVNRVPSIGKGWYVKVAEKPHVPRGAKKPQKRHQPRSVAKVIGEYKKATGEFYVNDDVDREFAQQTEPTQSPKTPVYPSDIVTKTRVRKGGNTKINTFGSETKNRIITKWYVFGIPLITKKQYYA